MSTTLTIRTDEALKKALEERAAALHKTVSQVARDILDRAVAERPLRERVGHLRGQLHLEPTPDDDWRQRIDERNRRS